MKRISILVSIAILTQNLYADELSELKEQVQKLQLQSDALVEEMLDISTGNFTKIDDTKAHNGMGAAASKVYYSSSELSIGGYGEMFIAKKNGDKAYTDIYRFIPYFGYRLSPWVIMNTELEFEHGDTSKGGKVLVEFMYLDFLFNKKANIRVGNLLVPMGITNLRHEPTLFGTVLRPYTERYLIPSTWHESGALLYGKIANDRVEYTAGIINALNMANADIDSNTWIKSARIGSAKNGAFSPAFVARVDYETNSFLVGGSLYYGDGSNSKDDITGTTMSIFELHALYNYTNLSLKALYTEANLHKASKIDQNATSGAQALYVSIAYNIADLIAIDNKLIIFGLYENYNLARYKADGSSRQAISKYNIGVNFFPTDQSVLKLDYETVDDPNNDQLDNTIYASYGFLF